MENALTKPDNAGAASYDYMHLFGRVALGAMWIKIVQAALEKKNRQPETSDFVEAKLITARFYMERMLPETASCLARITTGAATMMSIPHELF